MVAHGQMPEHRLEDVMMSLSAAKVMCWWPPASLRAASTSQANTLIVERADQLGLSQLYQIRGRVGRSNVTAHAYLWYPDETALTREAAARLRALADYPELGSGLRIAMRDLEIRGAGNLLGDEQTGHVAAIGFELYVEMLQEAVALGQGTPIPEREVRIEIPISTYLPADYVPVRGRQDRTAPAGLAGAGHRGDRGTRRRDRRPLRPGPRRGRGAARGAAAAGAHA